MLFSVYIDRIIEETQLRQEIQMNLKWEDIEKLNNWFNELLFADDTNLIYEDEEQLQRHIN